eukprot:CAMPEP_0119420614 /NCGR_PEP_ID=MMETSP1335-20130426/23928_1 /TAXON_ID=259385 /ORGANISM="Chrysoculter rhomboideus, Strain RCC1486" /LENGTH=715 /DNA_ID=CAMNT_0007445981 /DNA_START=165 /DNA_END=2312 /DNA_ORIENTATION=-
MPLADIDGEVERDHVEADGIQDSSFITGDCDDEASAWVKQRARRFSPAFKMVGMHGRTARRRVWPPVSHELLLSCSAAARVFPYGEVQFRLAPNGVPANGTRTLTAAELEFGLPIKDDPISVNKDRRWEAVAELFGGGMPLKQTRRSLTATLEPEGALIHKMGRAQQEQRAFQATLAHSVFLAPRHVFGSKDWLELNNGGRRGRRTLRKLTLLANADDEDARRVLHIGDARSLLEGPGVSLSASSSLNGFLQKATTHRKHDYNRSAWVPERRDASKGGTRREWLQVDLGAECLVTAVGTRGRFPITCAYPDSATAREMGLLQHQRYTKITVATPSGEWTTRYSLSARSAGGRGWLFVGVFEANRNETTEAFVDLSVLSGGRATGGIVARYLRFEPLEFHGRPALRVGVYGLPLEGDALQSATAQSGTGQSVDEPCADLVGYTLGGGVLATAMPRGSHSLLNPKHITRVMRTFMTARDDEVAADAEAAGAAEEAALVAKATARVHSRRTPRQLCHHSYCDRYSSGSAHDSFESEPIARKRRVRARSFLSRTANWDDLESQFDDASLTEYDPDDDDHTVADAADINELASIEGGGATTDFDLDIAAAVALSLLETQMSAAARSVSWEDEEENGNYDCGSCATPSLSSSSVLVEMPSLADLSDEEADRASGDDQLRDYDHRHDDDDNHRDDSASQASSSVSMGSPGNSSRTWSVVSGL